MSTTRFRAVNRPPEKTYRLLGVEVNALTIRNLNTLIGTAIQKQQQWIISNHNLHSIYLYHHDEKMRQFSAIADYVHIDGMPLVWIGRLLKLPLKREHRVTYADWTPQLMAEAAAKGWRIFYLGSKPGVAQRGLKILKQQFPTLEITAHHGYFDAYRNSPESQEILSLIQAYQPHILMVGMSMPRQEHWILDHYSDITANVILPSGAAIDYIAGAVPTPPRWAGQAGLEWLFRLIAEPKRLWQRYLIEPMFLLKWFLLQK
jgi:N-acetylglucosaminyldiphosphoundecaprenol N-acetyl-beta-D-mannosaminyltransferase